jgi:hypothetical protein
MVFLDGLKVCEIELIVINEKFEATKAKSLTFKWHLKVTLKPYNS